MPIEKEEDLPGTLQRSPDKAKRTFAKTLESAEETYGGDGERARRAAYSSLKHSFEKVGDHWEEKDEKGASDAQAAKSGADARESDTPTAGGVDVNQHSKAKLREMAEGEGIDVKSNWTKDDIANRLARRGRGGS
jgi:cation transport regulator ChaB